MTALSVLKKYWGYDAFRPLQAEVVASIVSGQDTLALLPTGGGKSICFQVPALLLPGISIVISPLVSLMKDQVDALEKHHIAATYLASSLSKQELKLRLQLLRLNKYRLVYVAPERLQSKVFLQAACGQQISQIVIDEAHCISEWGHTFRPNYRLISRFISRIQPRPVIAAVTATATAVTAQDIATQLQMRQPQIFRQSFYRNISIAVYHVPNTAQQEIHLLRLIKKHQGQAGIIYCATRKSTERLSRRLQQLTTSLDLAEPGFYHGGMSAADRSEIQQLFLDDRVKLLCATNAFGMGIDKPNVSFVIHYQLPSSIEQYYQEIGRAGRSGQQANAYLLFNQSQLTINRSMINEITDRTQKNRQHQKLAALIKIASAKRCVMNSVLRYFGETGRDCGQCHSCIKPHPAEPQLQTLSDPVEKKLLHQLLRWREFKAKQLRLKPYQVITDSQAQYLALIKPINVEQLSKIKGVGRGWLKSFGKELINADWYLNA